MKISAFSVKNVTLEYLVRKLYSVNISIFILEHILTNKTMENSFWSIIEADLFTLIPNFMKNAFT